MRARTIDAIIDMGRRARHTLLAAGLSALVLAGCQTGEYRYNERNIGNTNSMVNGQAVSSTYTFSEAKGPTRIFGDTKRAYRLTIESSDGKHLVLWDANMNGVMDHGDDIIVGGKRYAVLGINAFAADDWPENPDPILQTLKTASETYARIASEAGVK